MEPTTEGQKPQQTETERIERSYTGGGEVMGMSPERALLAVDDMKRGIDELIIPEGGFHTFDETVRGMYARLNLIRGPLEKVVTDYAKTHPDGDKDTVDEVVKRAGELINVVNEKMKLLPAQPVEERPPTPKTEINPEAEQAKIEAEKKEQEEKEARRIQELKGKIEGMKTESATLSGNDLDVAFRFYKNDLTEAKNSSDVTLANEAKAFEDDIRKRITQAQSATSPSTESTPVEDIGAPQPPVENTAEIEERSNKALAEIESFVNGVGALHTADALAKYLGENEGILHGYAKDTKNQYTQTVREKAAEALMNIGNRIEDLRSYEKEKATGASLDLDLSSGNADAQPVIEPLVADIAEELTDNASSHTVSEAPAPQDVPVLVNTATGADTTDLDFSKKDAGTEPEQVPPVLTHVVEAPVAPKEGEPKQPAKEEASPMKKLLSRVLRPRKDTRFKITKVDIDLSENGGENRESVRESVTEKSKRYLEELRIRAGKLREKGDILEKGGKLTAQAIESWKTLGKNYNELPKKKKILLGLGLASASFAFGAGAVAIPYVALRAVSSTGLFLTLDKAMEVAHTAKTGEERNRLQKYRHRMIALTFSVLMGSGLAVEAVKEFFPTEMVKEIVADTPKPSDAVDPLLHAKETLAKPDAGTGLKAFDDEVTKRLEEAHASSELKVPVQEILQEYEVKQGDTLYKIIRENFKDVATLPKGQQEAAIENILTKIKAAPASFGISSGDVNLIYAGTDHINLQKIGEVLQSNDAVQGEGIIEHVQKLDPQSIIDNKDIINDQGAGGASFDYEAPDTDVTPDVPPTPLEEESQKMLGERLDSVYGVKNVFGSIETPGSNSQEWLSVKEKSIGDILTEPSPSSTTIALKNVLGNLSLESGIPVIRGERVADYMQRALLKIAEIKAGTVV